MAPLQPNKADTAFMKYITPTAERFGRTRTKLLAANAFASFHKPGWRDRSDSGISPASAHSDAAKYAIKDIEANSPAPEKLTPETEPLPVEEAVPESEFVQQMRSLRTLFKENMPYAPILTWLPQYEWRKTFMSDIVAALTISLAVSALLLLVGSPLSLLLAGTSARPCLRAAGWSPPNFWHLRWNCSAYRVRHPGHFTACCHW